MGSAPKGGSLHLGHRRDGHAKAEGLEALRGGPKANDAEERESQRRFTSAARNYSESDLEISGIIWAISPSEFAKSHGKKTSTVCHHFDKLVEYGAIKLVREEKVGGSTRHMYVGTKRAIYTESAWSSFPSRSRPASRPRPLRNWCASVPVDQRRQVHCPRRLHLHMG